MTDHADAHRPATGFLLRVFAAIDAAEAGKTGLYPMETTIVVLEDPDQAIFHVTLPSGERWTLTAEPTDHWEAAHQVRGRRETR